MHTQILVERASTHPVNWTVRLANSPEHKSNAERIKRDKKRAASFLVLCLFLVFVVISMLVVDAADHRKGIFAPFAGAAFLPVLLYVFWRAQSTAILEKNAAALRTITRYRWIYIFVCGTAFAYVLHGFLYDDFVFTLSFRIQPECGQSLMLLLAPILISCAVTMPHWPIEQKARKLWEEDEPDVNETTAS